MTRIRTWVVSATTRSTNHYTITANWPAVKSCHWHGPEHLYLLISENSFNNSNNHWFSYNFHILSDIWDGWNIMTWIKHRSRQGSNLCGQCPLDFESNALTTRPQLLILISLESVNHFVGYGEYRKIIYQGLKSYEFMSFIRESKLSPSIWQNKLALPWQRMPCRDQDSNLGCLGHNEKY